MRKKSSRSTAFSLLHPSVRRLEDQRDQHGAFMAEHLVAPVLAALMLAAYAFAGRTPGLVEAVGLGLLVLPLGLAIALRTTGRLEPCRALSLVTFTLILVYIAAFTGGLQSFMLPWLIVIPADALLSGRRNLIQLAGGLTLGAVLLLAAITLKGWLPESRVPDPQAALFFSLGTIGALLYVTGMALMTLGMVERARIAAEDAEEHIEFLEANMGEAILRLTSEGTVLYASHASTWLFGRPAAALAGRELSEIVYADDWEWVSSQLARAAFFQQPVTLEWRLRPAAASIAGARGRGDGAGSRNVWIELSLTPVVEDGADRAYTFMAVARDGTTKHELVADLLQARHAAEKAAKAKSAFLAHMSHELRTPLNGILTASEMMRLKVFGPLGNAKYDEYAEDIHASGTTLLNIVSQVLDMSEIETGNYTLSPELVQPGALVDEIVRPHIEASKGSELSISVEATPDLPLVRLDRRAFRFALDHLVANARRYTGEAGRIVVSTAIAQGVLRIVVSDTGIGIPREALKRLGQPFEIADPDAMKNRGAGAGLGLAVVRAIAELHHGSLTISSEVGKGTDVTITLPAVVAAEAAA